MVNFVNGIPNATAASYAAVKNARFSMSSSQVRTIKQRWDETYNALPKIAQQTVDSALEAAKDEFVRRNNKFDSLKTLAKNLVLAFGIPMTNIGIDATMQRQLNIAWVITLLNQFVSTKVLSISVYRPDPEVDYYLAWDGQHTLVLLWLICTQIYGEDPVNFVVPCQVSPSHKKAEMRDCFIDLNTEEGKKMLDLYDKMEQMIYGVRVDNSVNPLWREVEQKQQIIESRGLFLTSKKFGDDHMPGAIGRMQEVYKMTDKSLTWLCDYLVAVGAQHRAVEEKEMVMMSYFFERCRKAKLNLTDKQVYDIADLAKSKWGADFTPSGRFWVKVGAAYKSWHKDNIGGDSSPRCNKEPIHGYPFLAEQVKYNLKGFDKLISNTGSEFVPAKKDLFQ